MSEIKKNEKEEELRVKAKISKMLRDKESEIKCPWCGYFYYKDYYEMMDDSDNVPFVKWDPKIILCFCKKYFKVGRKITIIKIDSTENEKEEELRKEALKLLYRIDDEISEDLLLNLKYEKTRVYEGKSGYDRAFELCSQGLEIFTKALNNLEKLRKGKF